MQLNQIKPLLRQISDVHLNFSLGADRTLMLNAETS